MRSRAPGSKTKIPRTIQLKSPKGSGAPVGFINPGSLMDQLPNKGSAQQTTLRATRNSWASPKDLNDRPEGQSNLQPKDLVEEERHSFLTPARLSDRKKNNARFRLQPASGRPLRPEGLAKTSFPTPTRFSDRECVEPLLTAPLRLAQTELTGTNRLGTPAR